MIGEVADLLLRHEAVDWVLCYGFFDGTMLTSLRTQDRNLDAGEVIGIMVKGIGTGGGHTNMAGGQIVMKRPGKRRLQKKEVEKVIRTRFLRVLKIKVKRGISLVRS
jgi:nanoRNase/pAp phosphatase (c-di-AMP/oligoRNAs hydrolase)